MKQVLQIHKTGRTEVANLPMPAVKPGHLLIRTNISLISSGTERMLIESSQKNILQQVLAQPEKIKKAIDRVHSEGVLNTFDSIKARAEQVQPLGYCNVGEVIEVGTQVVEYKVGDRVVSNGAHAEFVCVPKNLCAKVPPGVSDEEAVFTVLGAIALQGVRLLNPTIGESFAVMGLGTIGLLTVQLLRANGCNVVAMDMAEDRLKLAESFGAQTVNLSKTNDSIRAAMDFTGGRGVDGVVIAAATTSNEPLHVSASICRRRGRIVLTGVIGPELSRADFFEKEITFQVSCSYGPGRYDPLYEQQGVDYPIGYVRWTEQRNFEAFLDLIQANKISGRELISHRFPIAQAEDAYALLKQNSGNIAIALTYSEPTPTPSSARHVQVVHSSAMAEPTLSFVGAGNYGGQVLLPAFKHTGAGIHSIADRGGLMSWIAARRSAAAEASTDILRVIADPRANTLVIATRHDTHADLTCQALRAGKHVFVEKPLAINEQQLKQIE